MLGGRDGLDAPVEVASECGRGDLTGERRTACPGQDDSEVLVGDDVAQEVHAPRIGARGDLAPGAWLLPDLENRCAAVFLGGYRGISHRLLQC